MRINTCFEIQKNRGCIWQEIGFKQRYLLACLFIPCCWKQSGDCGKREGGLEETWLKSKEEIGSGEKVEILLRLNISISLKYWAGRKRM